MSDRKRETIDCAPKNVFHSKFANANYIDQEYYRSEAFDVPAGYIAVVELTTHADSLGCLMFTAVRLPAANDKLCEEEDIRPYGKPYRRWRCTQSLGANGPINGQVSDFTDYNKSIVRWGFDNLRKELVEFEYIVRPGQYYLLGDKNTNREVIENCSRPTFFDVTLIPVDQIPDLQLPCCTGSELVKIIGTDVETPGTGD